MLDDILPIDAYEEKHFPELSNHIKNHIENFIENEHDQYDLKRMIFISIRQYMDDFDSRPSTVPNLGINDDKMCANRYRKISRQVCKMGGWANFESYVNNSFVNEAQEFNKLALLVKRISRIELNEERKTIKASIRVLKELWSIVMIARKTIDNLK